MMGHHKVTEHTGKLRGVKLGFLLRVLSDSVVKILVV